MKETVGFASVIPLPFFTGEEGPAAKRWEVRVFAADSARPSLPKPFGLGPPSPAESGRGSKIREIVNFMSFASEQRGAR